MPLIEVKNLVKEYESAGVSFEILHGLNFTIEKGEFVAIMGPSGSGKSTLMHILGFLDTLSRGEYLLNGENITNLTEDDLAHMRNQNIGFVFQAFHLLPRASVLENVMLPLMYSKYPKAEWEERAKKLLASVNLTHRLNFSPNQLSGGERQRVAIARALVNDPEVIFADEPTGNLDSKSGIEVMKILQGLNDAGHTIILVTHEQTTARHAKRILHIKDGLIVKDEQVGEREIAAQKEGLAK